MATQADKLVSEVLALPKEVLALPKEDKLRLLDAILTDLDQCDSDVDRVWVDEARTRWRAYKAGHVTTVSYEELMTKYKR